MSYVKDWQAAALLSLTALLGGCVDLGGIGVEMSGDCIIARIDDGGNVGKSYTCRNLYGADTATFGIEGCDPSWRAAFVVAAVMEVGNITAYVRDASGELQYSRTLSAGDTQYYDNENLTISQSYGVEIVRSEDLYNGTVSGSIACGANWNA